MGIEVATEKRFESDIESFFLSEQGGYTRNTDTYNAKLALYTDTLIRFVKTTQPKEWKRFETQNSVGTEEKFARAFQNACDMDGLLSVLRNGFKHRGIAFRVCYFKPESTLNQTAVDLYAANEITVNYNEPINQDKKLKKISDLDIMKIRKKKKRRSKLWESEQHIQQSTRAK